MKSLSSDLGNDQNISVTLMQGYISKIFIKKTFQSSNKKRGCIISLFLI